MAVPVEVASLSIGAETTDVHLGTPIVVHAEATDPFGNRFVPVALRFMSLDTAVARVDSTGLVSAQHRGFARVIATANGVQDSAWLHAVQTVQAIVVDRDTLHFHSLGQAESLSVSLVDDHALPVADSLPAIAATDTALVSVNPGSPIVVRSLANGTAILHLAAGAVTRDVSVTVRQRTASLSFEAPGFHFDALRDTVRARLIALDSLGVPVQMPRITLASADTQVATVDSAGLVTAHGNGSVLLSARSASGVTTTVPVTVAQVVAAIRLLADSARFDALNDTVRSGPVALDRLGSLVAVPDLVLTSSDTAVAVVDTAGLVTSRRNGTVVVTIRAPSGVTATMQVAVSQRVAAVTVPRDSLRFEALHAMLPLGAVARDRLGSPVAGAIPLYISDDTSVITVDATGAARAVANGVATLLAIADPDTARVSVVVSQRPTSVRVAKDTLRFDALGVTDTIDAIALDSLGSPVSGPVTGLGIADTTVVQQSDSVTVQSKGNGVTTATFTVAGLAGHVVTVVRQVPTRLTAVVTFANPVVTLPVGASLPLTCQAFDRSGFLIPEDPLVSSVSGTVAAATCAGARVQRSGYDTLSVVLGPIQARIPVIVATAPDSVGVLAAAQPLTTVARDSFVGENLANPLILALRPLVADILTAYGNPTTNLGRARAIRDWVARTAVSPDPAIHPDGSTANLSVLPPGTTWADVNRVLSPAEWDEDQAYWAAYMGSYNGYKMLDGLLGTLDPTTGSRADDGLMVHVAGARYRIRDIESYHYTLCTFQALTVNTLWEAAGLQGMVATTLDHDPAQVFIPELGHWVYEDPTFSEEYLLDGTGDPLSPVDLLTLSTNGQAARLKAIKLPGPTFDPEVYIDDRTYMKAGHPEGMVIMGSQLYNRAVGQTGWRGRFVQIDVPRLATAPAPLNDPTVYTPVSAQDAFPTLGVVVQDVQVQDSVYVVRLSSTLPNHDHFERRTNGGLWEPVTSFDVLPVGACRVEYRSVDGLGNISASTSLDVWVPRAQAFVQSGDPTSPRRQAQYCM